MNSKILILALAISLAAAGAAFANGSAERPREVLASGASDSGAAGVSMRATLGQPLVGLASSSGGQVTLGQGFWAGGALPAGVHIIYLPLVLGQ